MKHEAPPNVVRDQMQAFAKTLREDKAITIGEWTVSIEGPVRKITTGGKTKKKTFATEEEAIADGASQAFVALTMQRMSGGPSDRT